MTESALGVTGDKMKVRPYEEINSIFEKRAKIISKNYSELIELTREGISLNFSLVDVILKAAYDSVKNTGKQLNDFRAFKPIVFHKSVYFLNSALFLFENGHIYATYSCLRTILESIWRLYFLALASEEYGTLYYKHEVKQISSDEKTRIRNEFKFFSASYMRKFLYTENKRKKMEDVYEILSQSSHPSITGAMGEIGFREASIKDLAQLLPTLGLGLLLVGHEMSPTDDQIDKLVNDHLRLVGNKLSSIPDLLPDNLTLKPRLRLQLLQN